MTKSEVLGRRKDTHDSLEKSIYLQNQLSKVMANDLRVATKLQAFWRSSVDERWPKKHSEEYEREIQAKAREALAMLDMHDPTSRGSSAQAHSRHGGTQLVVFSETHSRDRFLERVKKCFRSDEVLSVIISPNLTYDLPKERKIGIDEAGYQAWDMMRFDLIALSRCVKESYGSVEVNALVKCGD